MPKWHPKSEKRVVRMPETSRTFGGLSLRCGLVAAWCLIGVGCAEVTNAPAAVAISTPAVRPDAVTPTAAESVVKPEPTLDTPIAAPRDSAETLIEEARIAIEPEPAPSSISPPDVASGELAVVASETAPTETAEPDPSLAEAFVERSTAEKSLDFSSLVTRLRKTKAINLRTKLAVKNESDELLAQARVYHAQTGETTLAELRRSYDSLFQELHSLLEDADPPLARDIDRSRAAIWELIADPAKFDASI
jgi:hypothetical protein